MVEPGGIYHVTPRGNDGRDIFLEDPDRVQFLLRLGRVAREHLWLVYGYCLMTNHVHFLVQIAEDGLSAGMQELLGGYARWWNLEHGHYGHLFHNRFHATSVRSERHLIASARYVDLNPVRANVRRHPEQWPWSSYRAHVGLAHPARFLANNEFLELLGPTPNQAKKAYRRFVHEGRVLVSGHRF
jgi:REP element-mobilizing transposase RayT